MRFHSMTLSKPAPLSRRQAVAAKPAIIPLARIRRFRPCPDQFAIVERDYPQGVPLTAKAALDIQRKGGDVMWALARLMTKVQRQQFILYTLRLRQPHLVSLFEKAGLREHAAAIKRLRFRT